MWSQWTTEFWGNVCAGDSRLVKESLFVKALADLPLINLALEKKWWWNTQHFLFLFFFTHHVIIQLCLSFCSLDPITQCSSWKQFYWTSTELQYSLNIHNSTYNMLEGSMPMLVFTSDFISSVVVLTCFYSLFQISVCSLNPFFPCNPCMDPSIIVQTKALQSVTGPNLPPPPLFLFCLFDFPLLLSLFTVSYHSYSLWTKKRTSLSGGPSVPYQKWVTFFSTLAP